MSARSGGSFAALLMSGPLAAIPLMAVFGVPQFATVSASTDHEHDGVLRKPQAVATQPAPTPETHVLAAIDEASPRETSGFDDDAGSPSAVRREPRQMSFIETRETVPVAQAQADESTPPQARPTLTTLTKTPRSATRTSPWENAAQKLQELGIEDYRLERGLGGDTFVFICQFAPGSDPRIIRRFEAEEPDAATAVQQVLQQITDWQTRALTD